MRIIRKDLDNMDCTVCKSSRVKIFVEIDSKTYWQCSDCSAKLLDKSHFLSPDDEHAHYCTHENRINDPKYRTFLSRLSAPLKPFLSTHKIGLDYGCGPGPALCAMLKEDGYEMRKYDPFFYPDKTIFSAQFDFITCSEAVEHFYNPFAEFELLDKILNRSGIIGIMTNFLTDDALFENWYYRRDPSHVVFYTKKTFQIIANQRGWLCQFPDKNIAIFMKPD